MATRNPIILDKPEDWPAWIDSIRGSIPNDIWCLIDPDLEDHEEFMQKPLRPRTQEVNPAKIRYTELTATEKNVYDQLLKQYQIFSKDYEQQTKGLQDAKDKISGRVSDAKGVLLEGGDTARDWLATLHEATLSSKGFISFQTALKYQASIRKPPTAATIDRWLSTWEMAMAEARKHKIPEIESGRWLKDLATAMRPISEGLSFRFTDESTDDDKTDPKRYLEVSVKIREILGTMNIPKGRVTRGAAFAAELDGEPACDEDSHDERENKTSRSVSPRKRAGTTSALNKATKGKKKKNGCKACGMPNHELSRCFYAFPESRYPDFKPIERLVAKVAKSLEENKDLAAEVEKIRKEALSQ
jgi:hypothetical protein